MDHDLLTSEPTPAPAQLDLDVTGMTCAACAARIEKRLNRMDGVTGTVNYATERATVTYDPALATPDGIVAGIEAIGYGVAPQGRSAAPAPPRAGEGDASQTFPVTLTTRPRPARGRAAPATGDNAGDRSALDVETATAAPATSATPRRVGDPAATTAPGCDDLGSRRRDGHLHHEAGRLRARVVIALLLAAPVLVLSMAPWAQFDGWQWVALGLATPLVTWCAWPFHRAAWKNARHAQATMDTLVSLGVLAAYGWSLYALLATPAGDVGMKMPMELIAPRGATHHLYFEVSAVTVALVLTGRWFEARGKRQASGALRALLSMQVAEATVLLDDGSEEVRPLDRLCVGDVFVVRPGEKVATDGVVEQGHSAIDMSLVTGESVPVDVSPGTAVVGSTVNTSGRLVVRATGVGSDTTIARIARLVERAQAGKAPVQRLADRISGVFVPVVLALAAATLAFWAVRTGDVAEAVAPAVAVLVIACPCALGLATPMALLAGTGRGAQAGILIKGADVLEATRRVTTVLLDKTGTVTTGQMAVVAITPAQRATTPDEVLAIAAAVERGSEHPIARAIVAEAQRRGLALPEAEDYSSSAGRAAHATIDGVAAAVGRALDGPSAEALREQETSGRTAVAVTLGDRFVGSVSLADTVKLGSARGVATMRRLGITPMLVTGDNAAAAGAVAAEVGIEAGHVHAGVTPEGKVELVRRLQGEGAVVAMVGDGVNDAAALAQSDLGIAMGSGTDVAMEAGDITLVRSDLTAAADAIRLSRATLSVIRGNLFWAFAYNVAAIPLAVAWVLSPVVAGAAMAMSSTLVVANSLRLRRFRLTSAEAR